MASSLLAGRQVKADQRLPFGVFLAAGTWLTWLYGPVAFCFALMIVRHLQIIAGRTWTIDAHRDTHVG